MTDAKSNTSGLSEMVRVLASHLPVSDCPDTVCLPVTVTAGDLRAIHDALVIAASAQARIAELEADLSKVIAQRDSHWDEYLAERQSRMEHGAREAGYLDIIPKLTDRATAAEARADRLAKALETLESERKREGVNLAHLKRAVAVAYADMNRAALQQETQP